MSSHIIETRRIPGDCTKCTGVDANGLLCPKREECFRFVAESGNPLWQCWFITSPNEGEDCEYFWPMEGRYESC